jgi:hypothetical protein
MCATPKNPLKKVSCRKGQAMVEFVICLIVLITLISGVTTLATICLQEERLHRDLRCKVGESALTRSTAGWVDSSPESEARSNPFHNINAYTKLENYQPALESKLPMSSYTLRTRTFADGDLGLEETEASETVLLNDAFIDWVYGKGTLTISERLTFPATRGIWQ